MKTLLIIIGAVVLAAGSFMLGAGLKVSVSVSNSTEEPMNSVATTPPAASPVAQKTVTPPAASKDCGTAEVASGQFSANSEGTSSRTTYTQKGQAAVACFEAHLRNCTPAATIKSSVGIATGEYKIIGRLDSASCAVDFRYTENINPEFVGPKMTCTVNGRTVFDDAIEEAFEKKLCSGPLWDMLGI